MATLVTQKGNYGFEYAIRLLRDAVDFAESEGDFTKLRKIVNEVEASGNELQTSVKELEEGMRLMMTFQPDTESAEIIAAWGDQPEPAQLKRTTTNCRTMYVIDDDAAERRDLWVMGRGG